MRPRPLVLVRPLLPIVALGMALAPPALGAGTASSHRVQDGRLAGVPYGFQGETGRIPDLDARPGRVAPTPEQTAAAERMATSARWNRFGTPHVLIRHGGWLGAGFDGDPVAAARSFVGEHASLFRLSAESVDGLEVLRVSPLVEAPELRRRGVDVGPEVPHVVLFRQRIGGLPAGTDGLLTVGLRGGRVAWVSSSVTGDTRINATQPALPAEEALRVAAADVGVELGGLRAEGRDAGWTAFSRSGVDDLQRARLVALPIPAGGARLAWETIVMDGAPSDPRVHPYAFTHFVDAVDGRVWIRRSLLEHLAQQDEDLPFPPRWRVFPAYPIPVPADGEVHEFASEDTRELWCWTPVEDDEGDDLCDRVVGDDGRGFVNLAARSPWDFDPRTNLPSFTTEGNSADAAPSAVSPFTPDAHKPIRPVAPDRVYDFAWENQWYEERCNPAVFATPQRADVDAASVSLFTGHARMHDWSYYLGFTERNANMQHRNFGLTSPRRENDPETGQTQAGFGTGTVNPAFGRDNANQITPPDGIRGITNQYLWQPIASAAYVPCVDGAYDMNVVAHEYTHAISNRMTGGPDSGLSGHQARSMGESWSDLNAVEILQEYGLSPVADENPFAVGAYVTGDPERGVRNYGMNDSPLNYSDVGYDFVGPQVHADGEIWSAANFAIRQALIEKYDARFPASDLELQRACADGELPSDRCPGNRRWVQLMHDGFLLQPSATSMVDSRDAVLAADVLRYDGANQAELWLEFARHGLGAGASTDGTNDTEPEADFASPLHRNVRVTFQPVAAPGGPPPEGVRIFVGDYEARVTPIADTDPETERDATAEFVPGTYRFVAQAPGFGHVRLERELRGRERILQIPMPQNLASATGGATVEGDGINLDKIIDDTEESNWASLTSEGTASEPADVEGRQVTVDLTGDEAHRVTRVQVSAMLRPTDREDQDDAAQNRFSALRSFEVLVCDATTGADCAADESFEVIFTSPADAFPSVPFRPRAPDLIMRSFDVADARATHVRLRVLTNQCTGVEAFQGELDDDPTNGTDCRTDAGAMILPPQGENVRAAELQVFSAPGGRPGRRR